MIVRVCLPLLTSYLASATERRVSRKRTFRTAFDVGAKSGSSASKDTLSSNSVNVAMLPSCLAGAP